MKDTLQFIGKLGEWVAVKKLTVEEGIEDKDILFFFSSIYNTLGRKADEYVEKVFPEVIKLQEEVLPEGRRSEKTISEVLAKVFGPGVGRKINEIIEGKDLEKAEKEAAKEIIRVYLVRKALEKLGVFLDYGHAYTYLKPKVRGRKKK